MITKRKIQVVRPTFPQPTGALAFNAFHFVSRPDFAISEYIKSEIFDSFSVLKLNKTLSAILCRRSVYGLGKDPDLFQEEHILYGGPVYDTLIKQVKESKREDLMRLQEMRHLL